MNSSGYIEILNNSLENKHDLLKDMLDTTKLQSLAIAKEDMKELEKLAESKQLIINNIDQLDDKFSMVFSQFKKQFEDETPIEKPSDLYHLDIPQSRKLKENTGNVIKLINEIINLEKENKEKLLVSMSKYKNELKNITFGKKAVSSYNNPYSLNNQSHFIDKKK